MDIKSIEAVPIRRELDEQFANAQKWISSREYCLTRVTAEDGTVGWGECWGPVAGNRELIETVVDPWLSGKDVRDVEHIHDELQVHLTNKFHSYCPASVVSGVDIALWDLYGKVVGEPVSRLLGSRHRDRVETYATGHFWPPVSTFEELRRSVVTEAEANVDAGFTAIKNKIGLRRNFGWGPERDIELVRAIRDAVGDDVEIMADANHAYSASEARRVGRSLSELDVRFLEEPVPPAHLDQYSNLNKELDLSIAGGECWAFSHEFDRVLDKQAVDYVQPDVTSAGGVTSTRRVITAAESRNVQVVPHVFGSAVALAASLQVIATIRGAPMLEFDRTPNPIRDDLAVDPITSSDGTVPIRDSPGIGIDVDEELLAKFAME